MGGYFDTIFFADEEELKRHVIEQADYYDAVQDMPWPEFYRLLDETFPGSKFILTLRDEDRWIRSVTDHFGDEYIDSHQRFYGVPVATGNEDVYREHFRRHNREVIAYFADRPDDLLVMDITAGDGWEPLGAFLGVRTPPWPFPRTNANECPPCDPLSAARDAGAESRGSPNRAGSIPARVARRSARWPPTPPCTRCVRPWTPRSRRSTPRPPTSNGVGSKVWSGRG